MSVDFLKKWFYAKGAKKSNWAGRGAAGLQLHEQSISPEEITGRFIIYIRILYFSNSETLKKSASFSLSLWIRPKWKSFARRQPCVIWEGQLLGCFKKIAPKSCLQVLSTEQRAKAKPARRSCTTQEHQPGRMFCHSNAAILLQNGGALSNDVIDLSAVFWLSSKMFVLMDTNTFLSKSGMWQMPSSPDYWLL